MLAVKKHKEATEDYNKAKTVVSSLALTDSTEETPDNKKAFRKYLSDLSKFAGSKFATRSTIKGGDTIRIIRIS